MMIMKIGKPFATVEALDAASRIDIVEMLRRELPVARHMDQKVSWPWYGRLQHWLFVSWHCPCCIEERRRMRVQTRGGC